MALETVPLTRGEDVRSGHGLVVFRSGEFDVERHNRHEIARNVQQHVYFA